MTTLLKLGPTDHGRPMSFDDYMQADYAEGYQYELIDGKLYVSPKPNAPENIIETWLLFKLYAYFQEHREIANFVTFGGRVFVPGRPGVTTPEPDVTAFQAFPLDDEYETIRWQDQRPILVAEIISHDDPDKDLVRNVELYLQIPSIKEYWLFDNRDRRDRPTMTAHRRHGKKWRVQHVAAGETYTTRLLPGFALLVDPRR